MEINPGKLEPGVVHYQDSDDAIRLGHILLNQPPCCAPNRKLFLTLIITHYDEQFAGERVLG